MRSISVLCTFVQARGVVAVRLTVDSFNVVHHPVRHVSWSPAPLVVSCCRKMVEFIPENKSVVLLCFYFRGARRWCVTGTPIGKGSIDDLYGLLVFLKVKIRE